MKNEIAGLAAETQGQPESITYHFGTECVSNISVTNCKEEAIDLMCSGNHLYFTPGMIKGCNLFILAHPEDGAVQYPETSRNLARYEAEDLLAYLETPIQGFDS